MVSGAFDVHLPDNLLVQFNAARYTYNLWGSTPVYIGLSPNTPPPNPDQQYALPWERSGYDTVVQSGVALNWKPNDIFTVRSRYNYSVEKTQSFSGIDGIFVSSDVTGAAVDRAYGGGTSFANYIHSGYTFLDVNFDVFGIKNKITTGFNGYMDGNNAGGTRYTPHAAAAPNCNLYDLATCVTGGYTTYTGNQGYYNSANRIKNYMVGDEIKLLNDKLIILAGANYAFDEATSFTPLGARSADYSAAALTPTVSVIYKIYPWLSSYATYQQSLSAGTIVPQFNSNGLAYTNYNAIIPPYIGTQWETGLKATVGNNLLLTAALFRIETQNTFDQINPDGTATLTVGGAQLNQGGEITVAGKVWDDLTLFGGLTLTDARIQSNPASPYQNRALAAGVSPVTFKLYSEYNIPLFEQLAWLHNFTLTGGITYRNAFTTSVPSNYGMPVSVYNGYALGDLGFRYATTLYTHPLTARFTVSNVTNQGYYPTGAYIGAGRVFAASIEFKW
jgi:iron complex outermembrane receptor protein